MQPKDRPFPKYARDYFQQLRQQYELVLDETGQTAPPSIRQLIAEVEAKQAPERVSWADVFALESAYLYALSQDEERLRHELILARDRLRDVVGKEEYAAYAQTVPADVTKMSTEQMRAELLTIAERIRYLYTFVPPKESVRNKMAIDAALWTLGAGLLGIAIYAVCEWWLHATVVTILVVLFVGQMGGFLSVQQRLNSTAGVDPLFKELLLSYGWFSVVVIAPISGGIFAIVLYFLFVGGLMSGGLFPHFGPALKTGPPAISAPAATPAPASTPPNITQFLERATPTEIEDWGKLLVWAFIAGFAERFVPDVLTRLTGGQYSVGGDKPSGKTAGAPATEIVHEQKPKLGDGVPKPVVPPGGPELKPPAGST